MQITVKAPKAQNPLGQLGRHQVLVSLLLDRHAQTPTMKLLLLRPNKPSIGRVNVFRNLWS